jgi:hypothetical protein
MQEQENIDLVKRLYGAFGKGGARLDGPMAR